MQPQRAVQVIAAGIAALAAGGLAAWPILSRNWFGPALLVVPPAADVLPCRSRGHGQSWWLAEPVRDDETNVQLTVLIDLDAWLPLPRRQQAALWGALQATLFSAPVASVQR